MGVVYSYPGESEHLRGVMSKPYYNAVARPSDKESRVRMDLTLQSDSKPVFT